MRARNNLRESRPPVRVQFWGTTDSFLTAPLKADVAAGKLGLLDAVMAQIDLNQRLEADRKAISEGDGVVADATYFASLRDRTLRRVS